MGKQSRAKKERRASGSIQVVRRGEPVPNVFARVRRATVAFGIIKKERFPVTTLGTGVALEQIGVIATAGHVLDELDRAVALSTEQGTPAVARVVIFSETDTALSPQADPAGYMRLEVGMRLELAPIVFRARNESDLAIVKINAQESIPALHIDYARNYREGESVATCGFPYGIEIHERKTILSSFLTGIISAVVPHPAVPVEARIHYLLQMPANPGNSGGPVFDLATGNLLGVVSRRYAPKDIPTGTCIAEPIHRARQAIDTMGNQPIPGTTDKLDSEP